VAKERQNLTLKRLAQLISLLRRRNLHPLFQIANKNHGGSVAEVELPSTGNDDLITASQELIDAIGSGDPHEVADTLRACFQILDAGEDNDLDQV
jgi:hypothetical protein